MDGRMYSDDPITLFRPKAAPFKRRIAERLRSHKKLIGLLYLPETGEHIPAWIADISEKGMGCIVSRALAENTEVIIEIKKNEAISRGIKIPMRVVHSTAESDCCWTVGFSFGEALDAELLHYLTC